MPLLKKENLESPDVARVAWGGGAVNYDIGLNDPLKLNVPGLNNPSEGRPCRRLVAGGAGTLVYTGLDGVDVTLPATVAGQVWDVQAVALKATSTATNVVVFW